MTRGSCGYYWDGANAIEVDFEKADGTHGEPFRDKFTIDDRFPPSDTKQRYGMFPTGLGWKHIPPDQFPKEFRMHLLLLGVS